MDSLYVEVSRESIVASVKKDYTKAPYILTDLVKFIVQRKGKQPSYHFMDQIANLERYDKAFWEEFLRMMHDQIEGPYPEARSLADWNEGVGDALWWCWRDGEWLDELPYVGSPLDLGLKVLIVTSGSNSQKISDYIDGWPGYHTHWTPLPKQPRLLGS